jgi:hypothetical protein
MKGQDGSNFLAKLLIDRLNGTTSRQPADFVCQDSNSRLSRSLLYDFSHFFLLGSKEIVLDNIFDNFTVE